MRLFSPEKYRAEDKMGYDKVSRRGFITSSVTGMAAAGIFGFPALAAAQGKETRPKGEIIHRKLGRTGLELPVVSMGVMNSNNPEIVQASYDIGIRHFDTAARYQYGRNEMMVGEVVKRLGVRDKVVIATKELRPVQRGDSNSGTINHQLIELCEGSLTRLRTDYIDILYIHSVASKDEVNDRGMIEAFKILKKEGKVRFAGVSTHENMAEVINAVADGGFYDVVLTAFNVGMADDTAMLQALDNAGEKNVGIVAMKTQSGGQRLASSEASRRFSGSTLMTASLKWALRNKNVSTSIPGYDNFDHMREDFSVASDLEYTEDEKAVLSGNNITLGMNFCRQCRQCQPGCPRGVDIPTLMRVHMYASSYGNPVHAKATLEDIPRGKGIEACVDCTACSARCVRSVKIGRNIGELKSIYV